MRRAFEDCHPIANLLFFAGVLTFSMSFLHPAALILTFAGALGNAGLLKKRKNAKALLFLLPTLLLAAVLNPLFNHEGVTILMYLPDGNPLTREAIFYGFAAAGMLGAVILWFGSVNTVLTTEKLVYLFGRILPGFSLLLSMTLRFVPRFREQLSRNAQAMSCVGRDLRDGNLLTKAKRGITLLSGLVTWALESAVQTADSMKARGYGLPHRGSFSLYRFTKRDAVICAWLGICIAGVVLAWIQGGFAWRFYPKISQLEWKPATVWGIVSYAGLILTPTALEGWEAGQWRISQYRM